MCRRGEKSVDPGRDRRGARVPARRLDRDDGGEITGIGGLEGIEGIEGIEGTGASPATSRVARRRQTGEAGELSVEVDLSTHSAGGVTELDVSLARRVDEVAATLPLA